MTFLIQPENNNKKKRTKYPQYNICDKVALTDIYKNKKKSEPKYLKNILKMVNDKKCIYCPQMFTQIKAPAKFFFYIFYKWNSP